MHSKGNNKVTVRSLMELKRRGTPITALTAYDYPFALLADAAGVDIVLVGDSLGMTVLGYETTLPVEMEDQLRHAAAVVRGVDRAMVVADLPFMSYQVSPDLALINAGRLVKESGVQGVKIEGGEQLVPTVERIVMAGIPVMGHIGLRPQSVLADGGYRIHGRTDEEANAILSDAIALEQAGVFSIVVEGVVPLLAERITRAVQVPTIGIGAGQGCNGQIQVMHDLLGLFHGPTPAHARTYADLNSVVKQAMEAYCEDVRQRNFQPKGMGAK